MSGHRVTRRSFLQATGTVAAGAVLAQAAAAAQDAAYPPLRKALQWAHLPEKLSEAERFTLARDLGFEGVEIPPLADLDTAKRLADAAQGAGVKIHSIIFGGWGKPMSHPDPAVVAAGKEEFIAALRTAQVVGADAVLLVPAVVNDTVRYGEAWERSQQNIRDLIPVAQELKIVIAVENVWNKFLLSPLEFARYVDEFNSPWVRAYFDIGNVVIFGYPQDWIRTLGPRIQKLHVKDFKRDGSQWCKLPYEGDVQWPEVRKAVQEIGYEGWITEEFPGGDDAYLRELSRRMSLFSQGAATA
jgi:hexulose-6-phosphate isomerase